MNTQWSSTGFQPFTIGSVELFKLDPKLNKLPWYLAGGSVVMTLADPNGVQYAVNATIGATGFSATAPWTVVGPATVDNNGVRLLNPWRLAFTIIDGQGRKQVSRAFAFDVVASPA